MSLGTRIKQLRAQSGISQRELAKRAGITSAYVSRLENDLNPNVSAKVVYNLSRGLGTMVDDLLLAAGYYNAPKEPLPDLATYMKLTTDLDAQSIEEICDFVKVLVILKRIEKSDGEDTEEICEFVKSKIARKNAQK